MDKPEGNEKWRDEVRNIRIEDLKTSLARIRLALSKGDIMMADVWVLSAVTQLKSLEHAVSPPAPNNDCRGEGE